MTCEPEKVTGYVDGVLEPEERSRVEQHLRECATCREQADAERDLRRRLALLRAPEPSETLEARLRRRLKPRRRVWRWALPLAASLATVALWAHGAPVVVAWQLARDHDHCFGFRTLPAKVWTTDPHDMAAWLEEQGRTVPVLPEGAAGLDLVGGRLCPLADRRVGHVYYTGGQHKLSLFVVPGWVRLDRQHTVQAGDRTVRLLRVGGSTVGLVSEEREAVERFEQALTTTVALADAR